jgi:hypothetical protein
MRRCKTCYREIHPKRTSLNCSTCSTRKHRKENPLKHAYQNIKDKAKKRGHEFGITWEEWQDWNKLYPEYMELKGTGPNDLTLDRKDENYGYFIWNIQVLPNAENKKKYVHHIRKRKGWSVALKKEADDPF